MCGERMCRNFFFGCAGAVQQSQVFSRQHTLLAFISAYRRTQCGDFRFQLGDRFSEIGYDCLSVGRRRDFIADVTMRCVKWIPAPSRLACDGCRSDADCPPGMARMGRSAFDQSIERGTGKRERRSQPTSSGVDASHFACCSSCPSEIPANTRSHSSIAWARARG